MKAQNESRTKRINRAKFKPTGTSFSRAIAGKIASNYYAREKLDDTKKSVKVIEDGKVYLYGF